MILTNVKIFSDDCRFISGQIRIKEDRIAEILTHNVERANEKDEIIDGHGMVAVPGLIDIHLHGCMGADVCDGTPDALHTIADHLADIGVTAFAPATMSLSTEQLTDILKNAAAYKKMQPDNEAALVGINMEGPFISCEKKGAQNGKYIIPCDRTLFDEWFAASEGLLKIIGIAPENNPDAQAFIESAKEHATVTIAHSNADYAAAKAAFDAGASHVTHLYNGMHGFTHREPGILGAAWEKDDVTAEIICDGIHVHPAAVRSAWQLFGADRVIMISDSIRATGMKNGIYDLGGQLVQVIGNRAVIEGTDTIAGSVTALPECVKIAITQMQLPPEKVIAAATINPARCLGIERERGSLTVGKLADIVLFDEDWNVKKIILKGKSL